MGVGRRWASIVLDFMHNGIEGIGKAAIAVALAPLFDNNGKPRATATVSIGRGYTAQRVRGRH